MLVNFRSSGTSCFYGANLRPLDGVSIVDVDWYWDLLPYALGYSVSTAPMHDPLLGGHPESGDPLARFYSSVLVAETCQFLTSVDLDALQNDWRPDAAIEDGYGAALRGASSSTVRASQIEIFRILRRLRVHYCDANERGHEVLSVFG
jgi:hypothetical protein